MCILYALLSSHLKKRRTPYQTPGQDFLQLTHSGSPSRTHALCFSLRSLNGVSRGILRFFAYFNRSSWHSLKLGDCQGRIAPSRRVFDSFGTTRPKSTPMTRPKPRHVSQAGQCRWEENFDAFPSSVQIFTFPWPTLSALSSASVTRDFSTEPTRNR